jgi:hypothetical protein
MTFLLRPRKYFRKLKSLTRFFLLYFQALLAFLPYRGAFDQYVVQPGSDRALGSQDAEGYYSLECGRTVKLKVAVIKSVKCDNSLV